MSNPNMLVAAENKVLKQQLEGVLKYVADLETEKITILAKNIAVGKRCIALQSDIAGKEAALFKNEAKTAAPYVLKAAEEINRLRDELKDVNAKNAELQKDFDYLKKGIRSGLGDIFLKDLENTDQWMNEVIEANAEYKFDKIFRAFLKERDGDDAFNGDDDGDGFNGDGDGDDDKWKAEVVKPAFAVAARCLAEFPISSCCQLLKLESCSAEFPSSSCCQPVMLECFASSPSIEFAMANNEFRDILTKVKAIQSLWRGYYCRRQIKTSVFMAFFGNSLTPKKGEPPKKQKRVSWSL
jgi:hypothetical protein